MLDEQRLSLKEKQFCKFEHTFLFHLFPHVDQSPANVKGKVYLCLAKVKVKILAWQKYCTNT